ncbi:MAG: hypothetical protein M0Q26_01700 [Chitinophagaceae bacterium]|nr:hypothetical protein [Chitinophagaceae bacterium]MDP1763020.1 hypothetical protein [Sediminibacterium sp.]MDP1811790.1 hypothetical protein [Sediminibacterium sp.]MDP3127679.1 hypothetical protein [Sediminibacterium sp.]
MLLNEWDIELQEDITPLGLCELIEKRCQPEIKASLSNIEQYFSQLTDIEIPEPDFELLQLLYTKLQDEVRHIFLKESGLIYPGIKKNQSGFFIEERAHETIQHTQQVIVNLLIKLRHLLNNYVVHHNSSVEWKDCVHEFFQVENKIHRWIYIEQSLLYPAITHNSASTPDKEL